MILIIFLSLWSQVVSQYTYNFTASLRVSGTWTAIATDGTGTNLYACGSGLFYQSSNGGSSWATIQPAGSSTTSYSWSALSSDSSGRYVFTGAVSEGIWVSSNYGATWSHPISGYTINSITCNPTGQYVAAVSSGSKFFLFSFLSYSFNSKPHRRLWLFK